MSTTRNVTLSLPEALIRRLKIYAAAHNRSMTSVMAEAIQHVLEADEDTEKAKRRFLNRINTAPDRGTKGITNWTREQLHER